jgi:hypothetical protein
LFTLPLMPCARGCRIRRHHAFDQLLGGLPSFSAGR